MERLDETDLMILDALQEDSSLTNRQLAQKVHRSPTPVFERVKKMKDEGYIKKEDVQRLIAFRNDPSDESWIAKAVQE